MNFVKYQQSVEYQKSKGKNVNRLWQKLSNMSINSRVVLEKKKRIITSEISFILSFIIYLAMTGEETIEWLDVNYSFQLKLALKN